ncbi:Mediator of RNA polymerase II transcription subunit 16 [Cladophialophora chaetospira]|uniref:Mediator of RNA polymerase II transcription subunit 16 n=1 Tax=Cladophialophora chaetospira TaxID=386627 RepID=A0AA39CGJ6_9EURO|nr:Mediator of RNA polymerase II transcription subunit 16 [Cladophialophora chaetospira]
MEDPADDFASESFFDQNSLQQQIQQIDASADLNGADLNGTVTNVTLPPNPAVIEQLSRKWYSGCLERIAWSRHGHIASISEDGSTVYLECLRYDQGSGSWDLHERHSLTTLFEDATSLAWSATGGELAVVDVRGRVWIYHTALNAINRLTLARQGALDEGDGYLQPVGMTWLSQDRQERPRNIVLNATKGEARWQHGNARAKPLGPYWPRAIAIVHRNGLLTLCFQRRDGQYMKVSTQLSLRDGELYTHASFAPTLEGKMIVALHSFKKRISVHFLTIDWADVNQSLEGLPSLTVDPVSSNVSSQPTASASLPDSYDPDSWTLSHLKIVPTSDLEKAVQVYPTILVVSTGINRTVGITDAGFLVSGLIKRWAVKPVEVKLHPLFDALPSTGSAVVATKPMITLQEQSDKEEQVITTMHQVDGVHNLAVTTLENRTDVLSSEDLSPMSYAASEQETTCMSQSGFAFPYTQTILNPSFSPGACVRADIGADAKTQLVVMEYQLGQPQSQQPLDPHIDTAIAALNLTFARACWSNATIDDVLMCASRTVPPELIPVVISNIYRTMFRDGEFVHEKTQGSEVERMFHKQIMAKVFSYHASLAANCSHLPSMSPTEGRNSGWTLSGQWAWLVNNVRQTTTLLFMNLRDIQNVTIVVSQDFTEMLCANLRWGLSLIRFIFNSLLEVGDRETNPDIFDEKDRGRFGDTLGDGSQGLVALLLNCHASRIFLIAFVRAVRTYAKVTEPKSQHQLQVLQCIQQQTSNKGLSFAAIEAILEYRWSAAGDVEGDIAATAVRQLDMMATGIVHESYQSTIKNLLNKLINSPSGLRAKLLVDRLKLFVDHIDLDYIFLNQDILGRRSDSQATQVIYDVHRKRPITKGMAEPHGSGKLMVRKCVRCGSFSEDVVVPPREWPKQVAMVLTRCTCDGNWVLESWENVQK